MNYYIYACWTDGRGASLNHLYIFKSFEARRAYLDSMKPKKNWDAIELYEDLPYSVNDIFMQLVLSDPLRSEEELMEKAKKVHTLMLENT